MNNCNYIDFDPWCGIKIGDNIENLLNYNNIKSGDVQAYASKLTAFYIYFNYFSNIAMSLINYECDNIPSEYIERALFQDGKIAFFNSALAGGKNEVVASTFVDECKYNHYGELKQIKLIDSLPNTNSDNLINSIDGSITDFAVVFCNKTKIPLMQVVYYFCQKITELQQAVNQNTLNNSLPIAVECTNEQLLALNNIVKNISNQNRFIYFKKEHNVRPEELFKSLDLNVEFKATQMIEVLQYYKAEFFTMLGINSTPFEKKERLLTDEVNSNNQILKLTLDSYFQTQKRDFEKVNKKFGTNYKINLNTSINDVVAEEDAKIKEVID